MKYLGAVVAFASVAAAAAPPSQRQEADLRRVLQQYHSVSTPPPRQLTPVERAELRRQLSEHRKPPKHR